MEEGGTARHTHFREKNNTQTQTISVSLRREGDKMTTMTDIALIFAGPDQRRRSCLSDPPSEKHIEHPMERDYGGLWWSMEWDL